MRWIIKASWTTKKEDSLGDINTMPNWARLDEYIRYMIMHRAEFGMIDENGFEEILSAYKKRHTELMRDMDYYNPGISEIKQMIAVAWAELKSRGGNVTGVQYAVNLALKYFPDNREALALKNVLEKRMWQNA